MSYREKMWLLGIVLSLAFHGGMIYLFGAAKWAAASVALTIIITLLLVNEAVDEPKE